MKLLIAFLGLVALSLTLAAGQAGDSAPSIKGSYILEYRELPDGKQVRPPEVMGMMTFTRDHRNFNVYWMQDNKPVSISIISTYTLSPTEYTEQTLYAMANGQAGVKYETKPLTGKSPVTIKDGRINFKLPLLGEPEVSFDDSGFTATRAGDFVDHWKKID